MIKVIEEEIALTDEMLDTKRRLLRKMQIELMALESRRTELVLRLVRERKELEAS